MEREVSIELLKTILTSRPGDLIKACAHQSEHTYRPGGGGGRQNSSGGVVWRAQQEVISHLPEGESE